MHRRSLFAQLPAFAAGAAMLAPDAIQRVQAAATRRADRSALELATDEDFWIQVRHAYTVDRNLLNLNNGSVCPSPAIVQEAEKRFLAVMHMQPSHYVDAMFLGHIETIRQGLASHLGCSPEELALTRNTTESLQNVIFGLTLKAGDEVLTTTQDYPSMLSAFRQRELRDGIVLKQFAYPTPPDSPSVLTDLFRKHITPKTKVILLSHMTFTTGQVFPVKEICALARERGIFTIVDGAHGFAHLPFRVEDLGCDAYGSSLHKWLTAPIGTGLLYVRKERIAELWPLMGSANPRSENIRKFEGIGTHPIAPRNAITEAVTFHESIGIDRKAARLVHLRRRWQQRLAQIPGAIIRNGDGYDQAGGIGAITVPGIDSNLLTERLLKEYRIHVRPRFVTDEFHCIRVTPNLYTTLSEMDRFCEAIERIVTKT